MTNVYIKKMRRKKLQKYFWYIIGTYFLTFYLVYLLGGINFNHTPSDAGCFVLSPKGNCVNRFGELCCSDKKIKENNTFKTFVDTRKAGNANKNEKKVNGVFVNISIKHRLQFYAKNKYEMHDGMRIETDIQGQARKYIDDFSHITLKPETAAQLNANDKSKTKYAFTINRTYLLENPSLCSSVGNLTVMIIVHSAILHFEHRKVIRETWTNTSYYPHLGNVRVLFLLGREQFKQNQFLVVNEFNQYHDILQGDFIDSYNNMTHKNVMGLRWLSERCRNAKIVLKVDDDVVINMFLFFTNFAQYFLSKTNHMSCVRLSDVPVKRVGKWAVDKNLFKLNPFYPDYCQGFMVAITNDVIPALYKSSTITPFFWIDDVFAYGMVPENVPGMQYTGLRIGSDVALNDNHAWNCYQKRARKCSYFVVLVSEKNPQKLKSFWEFMVEEYKRFH